MDIAGRIYIVLVTILVTVSKTKCATITALPQIGSQVHYTAF